MQTQDRLLLEPYEYLEANPGKDFRSKMILAFDLWIKVPSNEEREMIKRIVSMLHTASLLVDDVEDGSELRRGAPVAHKIFGVVSCKLERRISRFMSFCPLGFPGSNHKLGKFRLFSCLAKDYGAKKADGHEDIYRGIAATTQRSGIRD